MMPEVYIFNPSATDPEAAINALLDTIRPSFVFSVVNAAFSASLLTLFVILLALSTKESRRRVVFRLNVFAICLVLIMGVLTGLTNGKVVVGQLNWLPPSVPLAAITFTIFPPLLCDSILLTRLFALYPLSSTPRVTLLKIFAFPFCIKCARVVVLALLFNNYVRSATTVASVLLNEATTFFRNPYMVAEWAMQIADNMYSVTLFLYNLRARTDSIKRATGMPARIRQIFYISAANFVFPLIFNIVLIIANTAFATTAQLLLAGELLWLVNSYVTVIGVLCATVWFSRSEWVRTRNEPLSDNAFSLKLNLQRVRDTGRECRSELLVVGKRFSAPDMVDLEAEPVTAEDKYYAV
ncbi:hypothetical protein M404DRAFT_998544 [Pisolithus tinctorius Marx 270]|uniref:G-protein coupled receptors family 1 profile domain-containing protein n=1 Tax=Pisolithus tinctorius Marx 270 TaxID=870435 RepID=A0A0C3PGP0_PISTI|nr:hypothetical protein M404DRAFT_998544 [Pisolithus tinctorius Marx 270]